MSTVSLWNCHKHLYLFSRPY